MRKKTNDCKKGARATRAPYKSAFVKNWYHMILLLLLFKNPLGIMSLRPYGRKMIFIIKTPSLYI